MRTNWGRDHKISAVRLTHVTLINGKGLPTEERDRLTEPYVTTRSKGTGLGLAIVRKIMEDHGGGLLLEDNPSGGARVTLRFPAVSLEDGEGATADNKAQGAAS